MTTSRLNAANDWTLGSGRANYITGSPEIRQNLSTRIKFFADDWFADASGIDYFNILGNKNNEQTLLREIDRVATATSGVRTVNDITVNVDRSTRHATITIDYTDIFDETFQNEIGIGI